MHEAISAILLQFSQSIAHEMLKVLSILQETIETNNTQ